MSEQLPHTQSFESFEHAIEDIDLDREVIQFGNGSTALLQRAKGDTLSWGKAKHARPGYENNCTIVAMNDGSRVAVGAGVIAFLPELDLEYGRFVGDHKPSEHGVVGLETSEAVPEGLPDITIGEEWAITGKDKTVESVMIRYKQYPINQQGFEQVDLSFSPLESAQRLLQLKRGELAPRVTTQKNEDGMPVMIGYVVSPTVWAELTEPIPGRE